MKHHIVFTVTHEEDGYSAAASGDRYFIVTQGDTFEELQKNIQEAVALHLEDEVGSSDDVSEVSLVASLEIPFPA